MQLFFKTFNIIFCIYHDMMKFMTKRKKRIISCLVICERFTIWNCSRYEQIVKELAQIVINSIHSDTNRVQTLLSSTRLVFSVNFSKMEFATSNGPEEKQNSLYSFSGEKKQLNSLLSSMGRNVIHRLGQTRQWRTGAN